jgi:hypothetical protein
VSYLYWTNLHNWLNAFSRTVLIPICFSIANKPLISLHYCTHKVFIGQLLQLCTSRDCLLPPTALLPTVICLLLPPTELRCFLETLVYNRGQAGIAENGVYYCVRRSITWSLPMCCVTVHALYSLCTCAETKNRCLYYCVIPVGVPRYRHPRSPWFHRSLSSNAFSKSVKLLPP